MLTLLVCATLLQQPLDEAAKTIQKVKDLAGPVIEKLRDKSPEMAARLRRAMKMLSEEAVSERIAGIASELQQKRFNNAAEQTDAVVATLEKILKILEARDADPKYRTLLARLEAIQKAHAATPDAKELPELTKDLADDAPVVAEDLRKAAEAMARGRHAEADHHLEKARQKLEEKVRKAEEEQLVSLEIEIRKVIELQKRINAETATYAAKGVLTRAEVMNLRGLVVAQKTLRETLDEISRHIEGGVVFRYVLESAGADMKIVEERLAELDCGVATREIEAEIVQKLQDLVDAFEKKIQKSKASAGSGEGKPPLDIEQLNLLRLQQMRILKKTAVARANPDSDVLRRLSDEEGELSRALQKLLDQGFKK